jgi:hypothetical protein
VGYFNIIQGVPGEAVRLESLIAFDSGRGSQVEFQARGVMFL